MADFIYKIYFKFIFRFVFSGYFFGEDSVSSLRVGWSNRGILNRFIRVLKQIYSVFFDNTQKDKINERFVGFKWFFFISKNQFNALENVFNVSQKSVWVTFKFRLDDLPRKYQDRVIIIDNYNYFVKWYHVLKYTLGLLLFSPKKLWLYGDGLFGTFGLDVIYPTLIKRYKPSCVVFSNDHAPRVLSLLFFCKQQSVKSIYIQHASVTKYFPSLAFDLSLLDGQDAYDKYEKIGKFTGVVKKVGIPKFDNYVNKRNLNKKVEKIGVCYGLSDDRNMVFDLVKKIYEKTALPITIRKHPADDRLIPCDILDIAVFSDARKENSFEFLSNHEVIFSGNSGILLEAVMINVTALYCVHFNSSVVDYYGYEKHNILHSVNSTKEALTYLREIKDNRQGVYEKAKYYNEAIGTDYEGRVSEMCALLIENFQKIR